MKKEIRSRVSEELYAWAKATAAAKHIPVGDLAAVALERYRVQEEALEMGREALVYQKACLSALCDLFAKGDAMRARELVKKYLAQAKGEE